jgi:hypothetical protein
MTIREDIRETNLSLQEQRPSILGAAGLQDDGAWNRMTDAEVRMTDCEI